MAARRAMGLPIPEQDEAVYTEAELETARMTHFAREAGISDDELFDLLRVLGRGLSQVAEALRAMPLKLVLEPGMSEPELANRYAQAAGALYPMVNPLVESCSRCISNTPRRAVVSRARAKRRQAAGLARGHRLLRRPRRLHTLGRGSRAGRARPPGRAPGSARRRRRRNAGAPGQDDRRRGDARLARARAPARRCAEPDRRRRRRGRGLPSAARRRGARPGAAARGRLVRPAGQPGQPHHVRGQAEQPARRP